MKIESCTTSKYRDLSQPGDDILVVLPAQAQAACALKPLQNGARICS
jgi:hypothetical protein